MIKTLEELRNSVSLENLYKYYDESLGKSAKEIKALLNGYGVGVSDECAEECYNFCKDVVAIKDEELIEVAGGTGDASVPGNVRQYLNKAIKILDDERRYNTELEKLASRGASEDLKNLLNQPFERESFKKSLVDIVIGDIGLLAFSNTSLKCATDCIQLAQSVL